MKKTNKAERTYFDRVHAWGRISSITALCVQGSPVSASELEMRDPFPVS